MRGKRRKKISSEIFSGNFYWKSIGYCEPTKKSKRCQFVNCIWETFTFTAVEMRHFFSSAIRCDWWSFCCLVARTECPIWSDLRCAWKKIVAFWIKCNKCVSKAICIYNTWDTWNSVWDQDTRTWIEQQRMGKKSTIHRFDCKLENVV